MIIVSLLLALHWLRVDIANVWMVPFNWLLLLGVLIFYFRLNVRLALLVTVIVVPLTLLTDWVAGSTPTLTTGLLVLVLFIGGWILQLVGHWFEKQKPAFMASLIQLLIGPLFFILEGLEALKLKDFFIIDPPS